MGAPAPASGACSEVRTLLVDLDGTLYDISNGYEEHVRHERPKFMCLGIRYGFPQHCASPLQK